MSLISTYCEQTLGHAADLDLSFVANGGDSLLALELTIYLQEELDADVDAELLFSASTMHDVIAAIALTTNGR